MKVDIKKEKDIVIIRLIGCLNYESVDPFQKACLQHLPKKRVIFNLEKLNFVGSIGITPFMCMMENLLKLNAKGIKMCCVGSEFKRIFSSSPLKDIEIHTNENTARLSFLKEESEVLRILERQNIQGQQDQKNIQNTQELQNKDPDETLIIKPKIKANIIDH